MIKYSLPKDWIKYNPTSVAKELAEAKATVLSLQTIPYQRSWVEDLQQMELKREVAGTSRIEGAELTERELEIAMKETTEQVMTRSQRQAHAAVQTYRWIAGVPADRPISSDLMLHIHRLIVTGADDDHCPPGKVRGRDQNVNFGQPRHRGVEGGEECLQAFSGFIEVLQRQYRDHDPIIQALAAHYHLAAMHPFLDGNGRTARALEALLLQRAGLRDTCFIAMSNYYYDEKSAYLTALAEARSKGHDLTPFLLFGLKGIALQSRRLLSEIQSQVSKALFKNMMYDLFNRLRTQRKRILAKRQMAILKALLEVEQLDARQIYEKTEELYKRLKSPDKAFWRDLVGLVELRAIHAIKDPRVRYVFKVRLEWPTEITETDFFDRIKKLPKAKTYRFLQ
ncbi:MAG: hypothetical protein COV76_04465 [Candidatus Omnitrophica bacterium CG11_big_fil_rev_8_21_14_0_20_64_10]|nr:MAG: hypothetical protein COV76_04465 [Candidatus Omnitrophica bacterium CG11_big_fil_rev_8_21_14_0_20_64_10]